MAIPRGTRIGVYEIVSLIGSGGMGEVYRARDTKLGRDVAIKVLANRITDDGMILARIEREARLLASLNHPAIATIHSVEEWQGAPAIVMELIEGETLAVRLFDGPLPVPDVVRIAKQVSDALTVAHDRGIVHRDLKPANIHLRPDGGVKVLDFGLAKSVVQSDTQLKSQTVTTTGSVMGTAPYMSPEQARGHEVDRRSDIWSFGAVIYELLTGKRAFFGATPADTIVAVLSEEPDWSALPAETPDGLKALLHRCLQKDVRNRLRDLGDASFDYGATNPAFIGAIAVARRRNVARWLTMAASLAALAAVIWITAILINRDSGTGPLRKFELEAEGLGEDPGTFAGDTGPGQGVVISPDGRRIVYPASGRLWVRELSQLTSRELDGTAKAVAPTWSPDSEWVAYAVGDQLRKSPITGGSAVTIATMAGPFVEAGGAGWDVDGQLFYSIGNGPIYRVSAEGGDPVPLIDVDPGVLDYHDVTIAGGRPLFVSHQTNNQHSIDTLENGKRTTLFGPIPQVIRHAAYSRSGHLVFQRVDSNPGIWAIAVDERTLRPQGEPFLVASKGLRPSVAADGTLVYVNDETWGQVRISFVNRAGAVVRDIGDPAAGLRHPALSPKGDRIAYVAPAGERDDLFMMDVATGLSTRLTMTGTRGDPEWQPDGTQLLFSCGASGREGGICAMRMEGGASEPAVIVPGASQPDLSADGRSIAYILLDPKTRTDVWTAPVDNSSPPRSIRQSPAFDFQPRISPDGRWISYASSEGGVPQVFVADYPNVRRRWQLSTDSGAQAEWNPAGGELFYLDGGGRVQSVAVTEQGPSGKPRLLFAESASRAHLTRAYSVSADGQSFVVVRDVDRGANRPKITVVENWFAEFSPSTRR
jgi:Tol biopolymer transport system component/tRNA A-37 threonylcarbamoyl transferase component Bud32